MPRRYPDRKGKVEAGAEHAQKTPLRGLRFESLAEAISSGPLGRALGRHAHSRAPPNARSPRHVRRRETRASATALEPFRYYQHGDRSVNLDGCVEVDAAYYSAPPGWIAVQFVCSGMDATSGSSIPLTGGSPRHVHQQRGRHRIKDEDRSPKTPLSRPGCGALRSSRSNIGALCQTMHRQRGVEAIRKIRAFSQWQRSTRRLCGCGRAVALEANAASTTSFAATSIASPHRLSRSAVDPIIRQLQSLPRSYRRQNQENQS